MKLSHSLCAGTLVVYSLAFAEGGVVSVEKDIPFGDLPRQALDIYSPESIQSDTAILVFFYGGGFSRGSKTGIQRIARSFSHEDMIVIAPNYRLYPEATFPAFVEDAALAVSYVWRNLRDDEGLPRPIFIGGWSAGAYISALVAYDGRYLEAVDTPPSVVKGFIGLAGPYQGGLCAGHTCSHIFPDGTEADWTVARFVDASDPPMLLVRGTHDLFVDKSNLVALAASGKAAGLNVTASVVEGAFHEDVMSEMAKPGTSLREAVDAFLANVLAENG